MIADELIKYGLDNVGERTVKDIRLGLGYICAVLDNGDCGLAYTFRDQAGECCCVLEQAGSLAGQDCQNLIPWLKENDLIKAAIGLSVINAVLNARCLSGQTGNVAEALEVRSGDTFGMVGEFAPILRVIEQKTGSIYVFEKAADPEGRCYPSEKIPLYLPQCDVVVITATSIINHTIENILPFCKKARQVCIVGPSCPLAAEIFRPYNVTMLAGSLVTDGERMLRIISEGGGTMQMKPALRHVLVNV